MERRGGKESRGEKWNSAEQCSCGRIGAAAGGLERQGEEGSGQGEEGRGGDGSIERSVCNNNERRVEEEEKEEEEREEKSGDEERSSGEETSSSSEIGERSKGGEAIKGGEGSARGASAEKEASAATVAYTTYAAVPDAKATMAWPRRTKGWRLLLVEEDNHRSTAEPNPSGSKRSEGEGKTAGAAVGKARRMSRQILFCLRAGYLLMEVRWPPSCRGRAVPS